MQKYERKKGIYRFYKLDNNQESVTYYIGESHIKSHGLKKRVTQNFTLNDTGGTFRKNLAKQKFGRCERQALEYIKENLNVQFIIVNDSADEVRRLEKIGIELYEPCCNIKSSFFIEKNQEC